MDMNETNQHQERSLKMRTSDEQREEFIAIIRPVMEWLCGNGNPHCTIVITTTNALLVEGIYSTGIIADYLKD